MMKHGTLVRLVIALATWCTAAAPAASEVTRIEIRTRTDVLGGRSFGLVGPYELLIGRVYFAVDPANPHNHRIVDLSLAPRNARGLVEFSGDLYILKPKEMSRGNGAVLYAVANRGNRGMPGHSRSISVPEIGDDFLLRHGYTIVWSGWQFDVPESEGRVRLTVPVPTENGRAIEGLVRTDFILYEKAFHQSLGHVYMIQYPAIDPDGADNVMTVRDRVDGPRVTVPRGQWGFGRMEAGRVIADSAHVYLRTGFEPGRIYEVIWRSHNPPVAGLGLASVRDLVSYFKYDPQAILHVARAYSFGTSQSGRFLREFIYAGFNGDEQDRKVFDGIIPNVAANGNLGMNHRFSQPSRGNFPFLVAFFTPTNVFPFTDVEQTDPETGRTDGMLSYYRERPHLLPKIFYPNASNEYWGRAGAVIHITVDGKADVAIPDNVRMYAFAGSQHGPAAFPPQPTRGIHRNNTNNFVWSHRALILALDRWVRDGVEPPPSNYPRIAQGTLVPPEQVRWPAVPGAILPRSVPAMYRVDFGPRFAQEGIIDYEPPRVGSAFPVLQAQVDEDGNEVAGVRLPDIAVPLATYTGWNLRAPETGAPTEVAGLLGSYIPFPRTREERERTGDPRRSIEERYPSKEHYLGLYAQATLQLIREGYVLSEDLALILEDASRHWDWATSPARDATATGARRE